MQTVEPYKIDLLRIKNDAQEFDYKLDNAFFEGLDQQEILGGEVAARVRIVPLVSGFEVVLEVQGEAVVPCDRCLDPVAVAVENEAKLVVKLGQGDDEEIVWVRPDEGCLDVSWLLYELVELSLPIVCRHREGECNPQMEELLRAHLCAADEVPKDNE